MALSGIIQGSILDVINGDTRSLDYGVYRLFQDSIAGHGSYAVLSQHGSPFKSALFGFSIPHTKLGFHLRFRDAIYASTPIRSWLAASAQFSK